MTVLKLSCGDNSFPYAPFDIAVGLVAGLGFQGFDLMLRGDASQNRPHEVRIDPVASAARIGAVVHASGLEFVDVFLIPAVTLEELTVNHPDAGDREQARGLFVDILEFVARLEGPGLTMLPGLDWRHETHAESLARARDELRWRTEEAGRRGVRFSIEPHMGSVCTTPEEVLLLCEHVPGLELTLDHSHWVAQGIGEADVAPLLGRARHLHARAAAPGRTQTSLDHNTIDFASILGELDEHGYAGYVSVEYVVSETAAFEPVDILSETVRLREHLEELEEERSQSTLR